MGFRVMRAMLRGNEVQVAEADATLGSQTIGKGLYLIGLAFSTETSRQSCPSIWTCRVETERSL